MSAAHRAVFQRHVIVCVMAGALVGLFWISRMNWSEEHRLWRASGDSSFVLLIITLAIGPLAKLWPVTNRLLPWRREIGIWFGILALIHSIVTIDGWIRWDVMRFFGYEYIPQLARYARVEPGFGLANATGAAAMLISLVLVATSSNWALTLLGASAWKWLQYAAYTVFYLVALHALYYLFIHFTESFHRGSAPPPDWFRYPSLVLVLLVLGLQSAAFLKTVARRKRMNLDTEQVVEDRPALSGFKPRSGRSRQRPTEGTRR